ncbi:MAG: alpha-L-fucosidase [Promethearchaeota archaeon]
MDEKTILEGVFRKEGGRLVVRTRFGENPEEFDVDVEELFEDLENQGVRVSVEPVSWGKPIFEPGRWEASPAEEVDPDYQHASVEARERFLDMKFGMMVHWGIYSVLGIPESWPANRTRCDPSFLDVYYTLWQVFDPTEFDADEWADLAVRAGMQFFQITTKHHDGFSMYDTKTKTIARKREGPAGCPTQGGGVGAVINVEAHFSIMETRFGRDVVGELVNAFRKRHLGVGFYFSHIDWNDPNFRWDPANRSFDPNYNPRDNPKEWKAFVEREREQLRELFTNYGPIDQVFFDGTWYGLAWKEFVEIVKMCRRLQPHCMFSDRGLGVYGDFTSPERWIPSSSDDERTRGMPWQVCDPIHTSWAYLPGDNYKPTDVLLRNFVDAVSKGGTYVFAIAPMSNGKFPEKTVEVLEFMGDWLGKNGEAIYATRRWITPKLADRDVFFTRSKDGSKVYVIHFGELPARLEVPGIRPVEGSRVVLLGTRDDVAWKVEGDELSLELTEEQRRSVAGEVAVSFRVVVKE